MPYSEVAKQGIGLTEGPAHGGGVAHSRLAFGASTGRTATMFLAATLDRLPGVTALHEGHRVTTSREPMLPLINWQNRRAWHDESFAKRTVGEKRDAAALRQAAVDSELLLDIAFYNAPLIRALAGRYPDSDLFVIFRRCESFVRSATILDGEDLQPAGWPSRSKKLSDRERFISVGRLKPRKDSEDAEKWQQWSAVERNIWLWRSVNAHLLAVAEQYANCHILYFEDLTEDPARFWTSLLEPLNLLSESSLALCLGRSAVKLNGRPSYQLGPSETWNRNERSMLESLALPLERKIYARST